MIYINGMVEMLYVNGMVDLLYINVAVVKGECDTIISTHRLSIRG